MNKTPYVPVTQSAFVTQPVPSRQLVDTIVEGMREKKAQDIAILDLKGLENPVADYYVICSGRSDTQNQAISEEVQAFTRKELGEKPNHIEGNTFGEWILLDYIDVVVHIFLPRVRQYFDIESLWGDADIERYEA